MRYGRTPREAAVFVHRRDRYLVLRRARDDYWHIVAGVVENNETFLEAARRELLEETGLHAAGLMDLELRQPHGIPDDLRHEYPPDCDEVVIETFGAEAPDGWEPTLNEEHTEHRWCELDEAAALLYWPAAREALVVLDRRLRRARPGCS